MIRRLSIFAWLFVGLFALSASVNTFLAFQNLMLARASAAAERKIGEGRTLQTSTQSLVNELVGLGQKHTMILPVLQRYGIPVMISQPLPLPASAKSPPPAKSSSQPGKK